MAVNSGAEGENICECGRVWLLAKRNVPQRDKDDLVCDCGKVLVAWNGGCVWTAKLIKGVESSNYVPSGTIIGYAIASGEKLFSETNRATRFPDQASALPRANDLYTFGGKTYRVVGVREGSTETLCEVDVREEPPDIISERRT